jgi:hypothetical protein
MKQFVAWQATYSREECEFRSLSGIRTGSEPAAETTKKKISKYSGEDKLR